MNKLIPGMMCLALVAGFNPAHAEKAIPKKAKPAYVSMVNGQPVLQVSADYMIEKRAMRGDPVTDTLKQRVRDELEIQTMMAQEVLKKGGDKKPGIVAQLDLARLSILSKAYLDDYFKEHPVTPEVLKADYEKKRAAGEILEYHLRNILVNNEKDARDIAKKLKQGGDFAALAKEKSIDPGADTNGGDVGWVRPDIFVDTDFADAVKTLKKPGDYTPEPVATQYGWNLLKLEEAPRKVEKLTDYEQLPKETVKILREVKMRRILDEAVSQLKAKAKITG